VADVKRIYIDSEYKCHATDDGTMTKVETDFFDGKCDDYIEGYRFIPSGQCWVRPNGAVFNGEMVAPWKPYAQLEAAQRSYERKLLEEYESLIQELYAEVTAQ
jgi:hypothetical protein